MTHKQKVLQQDEIVPLELTQPVDWRTSAYANADVDQKSRQRQLRKKSTSRMPWMLIGIFFVVFCVVGGLLRMLGPDLKQMPETPRLVEDSWQPYRVGTISVLLPVAPVFEDVDVTDGVIRTISAKPTPTSFFSVAYFPFVKGKIVSIDGLLNSALNASFKQVIHLGYQELHRKDIQLKSIRGKEMVATLPKTQETFISRVYFHNGRIFMIVVGGEGMFPDNPDIQKFLDSFQIAES